MLTTDLCLVYNSNRKYDRCFRKYPRTENGAQKETKSLECRANLLDEYGDLDPAVHPVCCAWIRRAALGKIGLKDFYGKEYEFCGETY